MLRILKKTKPMTQHNQTAFRTVLDGPEFVRFLERITEARKTCDHSAYAGMLRHGRCCPNCGTIMVDFGD